MSRFPLRPVFEHYGIDLPERGGWVSARCPVHDDSHASCRVLPDEGQFICLACGVRGGALEIIEHREGVTREAAIARAEAIVGVSYRDLRADAPEQSGRRVPRGTGYRPTYRRAVPARVRGRSTPWA